MSPSRLWSALTTNRAHTHPEHPDPRLRGRTYAVPFLQVWEGARELASGGLRGWTLFREDEDGGVMEAESRTLFFRFVDDVRIRVSLDENAQTRVDLSSASRVGRGDLGKNARRIAAFFRALDRRLGVLLLLLSLLPLACSSPESSSGAARGTAEAEPPPGRTFQGRSYERNVVFLSIRGDSTLIVPWSFTARTRPGGVERETQGWLARNDAWDPFLAARWETPPNRVPWRILPWGPVGLLVGLDDALEVIYFEEGSRQLEVILEEPLAEWSGQRAQSFRVHQGAALLSNRRVQGYVLDMSRAWRAEDEAPGDWAFLLSGNVLQLVLEAGDPGGDGRIRTFTGWARLHFLDRQWTRVILEWRETAPFEAARREVPRSWSVTSPGREVTGELRVVSSYLEAGQGEDPILPVSALFQVSGALVIEGEEYPVRGIIRHLQR